MFPAHYIYIYLLVCLELRSDSVNTIDISQLLYLVLSRLTTKLAQRPTRNLDPVRAEALKPQHAISLRRRLGNAGIQPAGYHLSAVCVVPTAAHSATRRPLSLPLKAGQSRIAHLHRLPQISRSRMRSDIRTETNIFA